MQRTARAALPVVEPDQHKGQRGGELEHKQQCARKALPLAVCTGEVQGADDDHAAGVVVGAGGQRQRVGIARALIMNPKLIIADECISALDVSIQAQVVNLMKDIQQETGTAYLFIAHDLSMVKYISDRIGVLHLGHLLETGPTEEIFEHPIHPYTRSLLSAIPLPNPVVEKRRVAETYDYATSGIDYSKGTSHHVEGSHYVKCTDEEFAKWCK